MELDALCKKVNECRDRYLSAFALLQNLESIKLLRKSNDAISSQLDEISKIANSPAVQRDCSPKIVVAFIGESSSGKTTFLKPLFPDVNKRGFLIAEATDTTSQGLRIEYAEAESREDKSVQIYFCTKTEILRLVDHPSIRRRQSEDLIYISAEAGKVVVDGEKCASLKSARFPKKVELPFISQPYSLSDAEMRDEKFLAHLTTKVPSSEINAQPLIVVNGFGLNALALRAIVKHIRIFSDYSRLFELAPNDRETLKSIVFMDTPGLATSPSDKDEVLKHACGIKSNEIARRLLDDDELDIIAHIVLVGRQSNFESLWNSLEGAHDTADEFSSRFFLIMTGMNQFFENGHLCDRHTQMREPDHFQIALNDNVLEKLGPTGCQPAAIAFVDSREYLKLKGIDYDSYYRSKATSIKGWAADGGFGSKTLDSLGIREKFADNVDALLDESDAGVGYVIRQLAGFVKRNARFLIVRRQVQRTHFLSAVRKTDEFLQTNFRPDGAIAAAAVADIASRAFKSLCNTAGSLDAERVEEFAKRLDQRFEKAVSESVAATSSSQTDWLSHAFRQAMRTMVETLSASLSESDRTEITGFFEEKGTRWAEQWGIVEAHYDSRSAADVNLAKASIKNLMRDALYEGHQSLEQGEFAMTQSDEDRNSVKSLLKELKNLRETLENLCNPHSHV